MSRSGARPDGAHSHPGGSSSRSSHAGLDPGLPATSAPVLWAHAASVGEMEGIAPLVRRWRERNPTGALVVTALTATGCATAARLLPDAMVRPFPLDLPWIPRRVVRRLRPSLFLFSENEIWPNAIVALARAGVPIVQVSGRISPGTAAMLARFSRLTRTTMQHITRFCVQGTADQDRLRALGVDPARITITGSLKGDRKPPATPAFLEGVASAGRRIVIGGSTHAGEEEVLLDALIVARGNQTKARRSTRAGEADDSAETGILLVLAPRHPERFDEVEKLLRRRSIRFVRRTTLPADSSIATAALGSVQVLLLDTIGELAGYYPVACVAFIGGSLVPVGGHNLLEAAGVGVPIVTGPHVDSIAALAVRLREAGAATVVTQAGELRDAVEAYLRHPSAWDRASRAARVVAERETGGLEATWAAIEALEGGRANTRAGAGGFGGGEVDSSERCAGASGQPR